jgi:DNA polymerase III epsilon subunit-like protein
MILRSITDKNLRLIWFDIETTGFNIFHHNIIEIAAVDNKGKEFSCLIKCNTSLPKKITQITGITDEILYQEGIEIIDALKKFREFLLDNQGNTTYLIGHNSYSFDIPFIKAQFMKYNLKFPSYESLDTMRIAQFIMPSEWSHSLNYLCQLFGIENKQAHRALSDVYATQAIYKNLIIIYKSVFKTEVLSLNNIIKKTKF